MHHLQQSQLYFWVKSTRGLTMLSKLQRGRQITRWQQRQLVRVGSTAFQILGDFLALINWRFLLWMLYVLLKLRMHERCLLLGDSTPHLYSLFPIISIAWCGWFGRVCIGQCVTWDIYFGYRPSMLMTSPHHWLTIPLGNFGDVFVKRIVMAGSYW